jgi:hypothetical protein
MEPCHLEKLMAEFKKRPWLAMAHGSYGLVDRHGTLTHQYGPLYAQAEVANPFLEVQRILPAGLGVQGPVVRKEAMRSFAQWDRVIPPDFPYGLHDFLNALYLQSFFESACVPEKVFSITADTTTANTQNDISDRWLSVLEGIARCYDRLFDFVFYPHEILVPYQRMMVNTTVKALYEAMTDAEKMKDLNFIQEKLDLLQQMAQFGERDMVRAAKHRAQVFQKQNPNRPLGPVDVLDGRFRLMV